jgi:hypothetical protein
MPRKPLGNRPLTNAERQARHRAARAASRPVNHYRPAADRRSRAQRWRDAVAELVTLQGQYAQWFEALPENLQQGAYRRGIAGDRRSRPRRSDRPPATARLRAQLRRCRCLTKRTRSCTDHIRPAGARYPGRQLERPADFNRDGWPTSIGMPGRHHRNTHLDILHVERRAADHSANIGSRLVLRRPQKIHTAAGYAVLRSWFVGGWGAWLKACVWLSTRRTATARANTRARAYRAGLGGSRAGADRGAHRRVSRPTVWRREQRFAEAGVEGLLSGGSATGAWRGPGPQSLTCATILLPISHARRCSPAVSAIIARAQIFLPPRPARNSNG